LIDLAQDRNRYRAVVNMAKIFVSEKNMAFTLTSLAIISVSRMDPIYEFRYLTFWRRNYFFLILAHSVYKM